MTPPSFPQLAGQGWSVHKRPTFSTRVASHVSGGEVRSPPYVGTLYEFELTFDALASASSAGAFDTIGADSLQVLLGFFLQCQGQYGTFLYQDPNDNVVEDQTIATGDGLITTFVLQRTIGGYSEPVSYATQLDRVAVAGTTRDDVTLVAPNSVTFVTAPPAGAAITADFSYAFLCRFLDDQQDFEKTS